MRRKQELRDATRPIKIYISPRDINLARLAKNKGKPPQTSCVIVQAGLRQPNVVAVNVQANYTRIWKLYKTITVVERYMNGPSARTMAKAWDEWDGATPGWIELKPPVGIHTLEELRSPKAKARRDKSKAKRAREGTPPREYHKIDRKLRWGLGQHSDIA